MRNAILGAAGAALIASSALAADLPVKAPAYAAVAAPMPSWSGWIISGVVGGDWNDFKFTGFGTDTSMTPSAVAFGVKSELIYMFNPVFGVEHKLLVRYSSPSVSSAVLGIPSGTNVPYWRGDSFANLVIAINNQWAFDAGVGIAAQTLKFDVIGGIKDPTYGWAFDAGLKWKPSIGPLPIVAGLDFVYEDMDGLALGRTSTQVTNFGVFGSLGVELQ